MSDSTRVAESETPQTKSGDDYVVVGAGLGGLTAGALLADAGHQVRVLEAHQQPGGCATTFTRFDTEIEVSLHEMEGLDEYDLKRSVFERLGVFEHVEFERTDQFYRYIDPGRDVDVVVPHGRDAAIDGYAAAFPDERDGIRRFIDTLLSIRHEVADWPFFEDPSVADYALAPIRQRTMGRYRNATVGDLLDRWIDDETCKVALAANLSYYHDDPYDLSVPFFAVAQGGYLEGGSYYVRGGSQQLSDYLVSCIEDAGGRVECGRLVSDIHVDHGQVSGVTHAKTHTGTDERTTRVSSVVANAALPNVADDLLPAEHGAALSTQLADFEVAPSLTTLYLVFEPPVAELGNDYYSTVIEGPSIDTLADLGAASTTGFGSRRLGFVDYSQVTADLAPEGKSVGAITTVDYYEEWTGLTDSEYRQKKRRVGDVLLRRLDEVIPGVEDAVAHRELATPLTIERFTRNPNGTAYGFAQTPEQALGNRTVAPPVQGLEFASAWSNPGGGFTGAILSGAKTAATLAPQDGCFRGR